MLRGHIRLGRIFGIEIALHLSWLIIAALLTMSLAGHLYSMNREWPAGLVWTAAGVSALAFFAAILLHELSLQRPVLEHGQMRGVISRNQILRLVATRSELTM